MSDLVQHEVDEKLTQHLFLDDRAEIQRVYGETPESVTNLKVMRERAVLSSIQELRRLTAKAAENALVLNPPQRRSKLEHDVRADNLARARICKRRPVSGEQRIGRRCPTQHVVSNILCFPISIVGLHANLDRVSEANLLEGTVPRENTFPHGVAKLHRRRILDPPHDRLDRLGELRFRILLDEVPTLDEVPVRCRVILSQIRNLLGEVTHSMIGQPRLVIVLRNSDQ